MRRIKRYAVTKGEATALELHVRGKILALDETGGSLSIIVEENTDHPTRARYFNVFPDDYEDMGAEWEYTGNRAWDGGQYYFLYEDMS